MKEKEREKGQISEMWALIEVMIKLTMEINELHGDSTLLEASLNKVMFTGRYHYEKMMRHLNKAKEVMEGP